MPNTWILVADGARARLFATAAADEPLTEVACFSNPEGRAAGRDLTTDRPPRVNESVGDVRHAIEPHTTLREKSAGRFARTLNDALESGHNDRRYDRLVLIAPPRFLGALHESCGKQVRALVVAEIRHDLTMLPPSEIRERLPQEALA